MEWVETTAKTVEEAKELALDQLGVDGQDAEFEVLEEPRTGLFGRLRGEARVRARVRPMQPRPKVERRDRRKGGERGGKRRSERTPAAASEAGSSAAKPTAGAERTDTSRGRGRRGSADRDQQAGRGEQQMTEAELGAQEEVVRRFLSDLLDAFDVDAEVTLTRPDEETIEASVQGDDLGLLIGPKGQTLQAIQELCRSVVQRRRPGELHARLRIDIAGYRQRRKEALERFAQQVADEVKRSGAQKALEPMTPPDRKIVHDAINEIDGVVTSSEGEEPRRRVVISPA